jgi:hypothetical protein
VTKDRFCILNTPPVVCQQSFLNWLDIEQEGEQIATPEQNVRNYARIIAKFFDLPVEDTIDELAVNSIADLSFLNRLRRRGDFSPADIRHIRTQILNSESYYIPRAKMVYLANLSVNHAAEEATHFLRHVCSDTDSDPRFLVDAFYARCIEEAVGFLGSKLINHKRKTTGYRALARVAKNDPDKRQRLIARLTLQHWNMERGKKVRSTGSLYNTDAHTFNAITHLLGYQLGERLYYGLIFGDIAKDEIRQLFFENFDDGGTALKTYFHWALRTTNVQIPERL